MIRSSLTLALLAAASISAHAVVTFNQNVTNNVIMGTGITNGGFTVDRANNFEIGLRARERHDLATDSPTNVTGSNGNGNYTQNRGEPTGFTGPTQNRARWNFDWSVNSNQSGGTGGRKLAPGVVYQIWLDYDPGLGTRFFTFDPLNFFFADHSFGNNDTAQSAGVEAADATAYESLLANNNLVQQSWNFGFFDSYFSFDPTVNGKYTIFLQASDSRGVVLARSEINVLVGDQASLVPEPGSMALVGLALAGLAVARRRKS